MPFTSRAQERAAFGGYLGKEMKGKAKEWASKTDQSKLPAHAKSKAIKNKKESRKKEK